jgi:hypothetical protein
VDGGARPKATQAHRRREGFLIRSWGSSGIAFAFCLLVERRPPARRGASGAAPAQRRLAKAVAPSPGPGHGPTAPPATRRRPGDIRLQHARSAPLPPAPL